MFYRRTQAVEMVTATKSAIVCAVVIDFDSDAWAERFVLAMVAAHLLAVDGESITIKGNNKHVGRLTQLRATASAGAKAKNAKYPMFVPPRGEDVPASSPPVPRAPSSLLLAPSSLLQDQIQIRDPKISESASRVSPRKPKSPRTPEEQAKAAEVRQAFHAGYRGFYKREITGWGAKENAHIYDLLKTWPAAELAVMAAHYFAWKRDEVIRAGHPFMGTYASFSAKVHELHADLLKPERRALAAEVRDLERIDTRDAEEAAQSKRVLKLLNEELEYERLGRTGNTGQHIERGSGTAAQAGLEDRNAVRHPQPQVVGRSETALVADPATVRKREGDLEGD